MRTGTAMRELRIGLGVGASSAKVRSRGLPFPRPAAGSAPSSAPVAQLPCLFAGETLSESGWVGPAAVEALVVVTVSS